MIRDKEGSGFIEKEDFCVFVEIVPWHGMALQNLAKRKVGTLLLFGYFLHSLLAQILQTIYTAVPPLSVVLPSVLSVTCGQPQSRR